MKIVKRSILFLILLSATTFAFSNNFFFSGLAGGKIDMASDVEAEKYDPTLSLQSFFSGQFGFSENAWCHLEFSIDTNDLIGSSVFHKTDSYFQLDELSVTFRQSLDAINNYVSFFMGTYDPIGSDIFLQRQFNINPITSTLTESWLGMAGSLLYPHFGLGISDVIHFSKPMAAGLYIYLNHEDEDYYVINGDVRYACAYRFLTLDVAAGLGAPLAQKYKAENVIVVVETLYWHVGTTLLVGNNYTQSFFLQAGIYNASFKPNDNGLFVYKDDFYLFVEPRFRSKTMQIHLTVFSLPKTTVEDLLFIHDTFGINLDIFYDQFAIRNKSFKFGFHTSLSFPEKYIFDISSPLFESIDSFNINITPYIETNILNGELNAMVNFGIMNFVRGEAHKAISISVGYKTSF